MTSIYRKALRPSSKSTSTKEVLFDSGTTSKILNDSQTSILDSSSVSTVVHQDEPELKYRLFKNRLFTCTNIENEYFTNFLPSEFYEIEPYIQEGLELLQKDPTLLSMSKRKVPANQVHCGGEFKDHIKNIMEFYDKDYDCNGQLLNGLIDGFVRKSKIESPLGDSSSLRLISLYSKDLKTGNTYMDLIFIDFYHLFIPSKHKQKSAHVIRQEIYSQKRSRNKQVPNEYFSSLVI